MKVSVKGESQRDEGRFSEADYRDCAWWCNNAEIELDVVLVWEEDDDSIGFDLILQEWVSLWEENVIVLFDWESSNWQFKKSLTEDVDNKLEDVLGYYSREIVSELRSEAFFRFGVFAKVDGSSILFPRTEVVGWSQSVASNKLRYLKDFYFLGAVFNKRWRLQLKWNKIYNRWIRDLEKSMVDSGSYQYRW